MYLRKERKLVYWLCIVFLFAGDGCASTLKAVTSGQVGCSENEIEIVEDNVGFSTRTWVAECNGRTYHCSAHGGGYGAAQVVCTERQRPHRTIAAAAQLPAQGCQYDTQCKGNRLCQNGRCVDPGQAQATHPPQSASPASNTGAPSQPMTSAMLQSRCDNGSAESCVALAKMYEEGNDVAKDRARAAELYEKGCRSGNAAGCKGMMRTAK